MYAYMQVCIQIYIDIYIYTQKLKSQKLDVLEWILNIKNIFSIVTNISDVLHNLLQCVWIKHFKKTLHTQQKLKIN